jgi:cbb3-type cytochrome oxidase subunit 3
MIRDLLGTMDTGILAQIGLVAFMVAFAAILVYVFTLRKEDRESAKRLPLDDSDEIVIHSN